ncbi:hypothetical protein [Thiolinea disciformis]|uniref:hypothetical protein n=1 Tax=Thiolinea disciformis TaxID=125614 RepID=UPI0003A2F399|nr:hypothetical protein [Thiolinea disciformis]
MLIKNGDHASTLKSFQDSPAIRKKLADIDPNIVEWQTDLVVSYWKIAQVQPEQQHALLSDALAILKKLDQDNKLDAEKKEWIAILKKELKK